MSKEDNLSPPFTFPVRVYYEDTDAGGIVYYANYLKFFERARTEWLRHLGIEQDGLLSEQKIGFVVRQVHMDNYQPARFNDLIVVVTQISELRRARVEFQQKIIDKHEQVLVSAKIVVACVDIEKMKPVAIPAAVKGVLVSVI